MIYLIIVLLIWIFIWFIIQIMIIKKDRVPIFKKILDNTVFNLIVVISWVIIIIIVIPFLPQSLLIGDFTFILDIIGQILMILGILNFVWIFLQKRRIGAQEMNKLLTKGAYGISRHPIYLSQILFFFGHVFERGALDALILSPLIILLYSLTAKVEEKYSIGKIFDEEYEEYKKTVPMFMKWYITISVGICFIAFLIFSLHFGLLFIQYN